jgi:hypothetical protein
LELLRFLLVLLEAIPYIAGMARKPRRAFTFRMTAEDEQLLRAYADAIDQTMTSVLLQFIRSLKARLAKLRAEHQQGAN